MSLLNALPYLDDTLDLYLDLLGEVRWRTGGTVSENRSERALM